MAPHARTWPTALERDTSASDLPLIKLLLQWPRGIITAIVSGKEPALDQELGQLSRAGISVSWEQKDQQSCVCNPWHYGEWKSLLSR